MLPPHATRKGIVQLILTQLRFVVRHAVAPILSQVKELEAALGKRAASKDIGGAALARDLVSRSAASNPAASKTQSRVGWVERAHRVHCAGEWCSEWADQRPWQPGANEITAQSPHRSRIWTRWGFHVTKLQKKSYSQKCLTMTFAPFPAGWWGWWHGFTGNVQLLLHKHSYISSLSKTVISVDTRIPKPIQKLLFSRKKAWVCEWKR